MADVEILPEKELGPESGFSPSTSLSGGPHLEFESGNNGGEKPVLDVEGKSRVEI